MLKVGPEIAERTTRSPRHNRTVITRMDGSTLETTRNLIVFGDNGWVTVQDLDGNNKYHLSWFNISEVREYL